MNTGSPAALHPASGGKGCRSSSCALVFLWETVPRETGAQPQACRRAELCLLLGCPTR